MRVSEGEHLPESSRLCLERYWLQEAQRSQKPSTEPTWDTDVQVITTEERDALLCRLMELCSAGVACVQRMFMHCGELYAEFVDSSGSPVRCVASASADGGLLCIALITDLGVIDVGISTPLPWRTIRTNSMRLTTKAEKN